MLINISGDTNYKRLAALLVVIVSGGLIVGFLLTGPAAAQDSTDSTTIEIVNNNTESEEITIGTYTDDGEAQDVDTINVSAESSSTVDVDEGYYFAQGFLGETSMFAVVGDGATVTVDSSGALSVEESVLSESGMLDVTANVSSGNLDVYGNGLSAMPQSLDWNDSVMPGDYNVTITQDGVTESTIVTVDDESTTVASIDSVGDSWDVSDSPVAIAGPNESVTPGETVTFDASDSTGVNDSLTYEWSFDDGSTATGATANQTFDSVGTYEVTLTVTDEHGAVSTDNVSVTVEEASEPDSGGGGTVDEGDDDDTKTIIIGVVASLLVVLILGIFAAVRGD